MQTHNYHLQAGWYHCAGAALDLISLQWGKIIMGSFVVARKSGEYLRWCCESPKRYQVGRGIAPGDLTW